MNGRSTPSAPSSPSQPARDLTDTRQARLHGRSHDRVLGDKRLVFGIWLAVSLLRSRRSGRRAPRSRDQFSIPGREGFETNKDLAATYGSGGDARRSCPWWRCRRARRSTRRASRPAARGGAGEDRGGGAGVDAARPTPRPATGLRLRRRPHDVRARVHPGQGRHRSRAGRGARRAGRGRRRHRRRRAGRRSPASTRCAPRPATTARRRHRASRWRRCVAGAGRAARPDLRVRLVDGDRADADGARRDPDDVPAVWPLAERTAVSVIVKFLIALGRPRDRDRLRAAGRRALAGGAPARRTTRTTRPCAAMEHAGKAVVFSGTTVAISLLALVVAARPVPAQHRHRRHADPAGQRRRRDHAAAGRPGHDRPAAGLAAHAHREDRASRGWTAWARFVVRHRWAAAILSTAVLAGLVRRRVDDPARQPAARVARPGRSGPHRARPARRLAASAAARCRRSTRSSAPATPSAVVARARASVEGVRTAIAPGRLAPRRHVADHRHPDRGRQLRRRAGDARPRPRGRRCRRGRDRRRGGPERRLPRFRLRQLPARGRADRRAHVPAARPRVPLADHPAQGRPAEPAVGRRRLGPDRARLAARIRLRARSGASRPRRRSTSRCRSSSSRSCSASRWTTRCSSSAACGRPTTAPARPTTAVVEGIGRTGRLVTSAALILGLAFVAIERRPRHRGEDVRAPRSAAASCSTRRSSAACWPRPLVAVLGRWNWWLPDGRRESFASIRHPSSSRCRPACRFRQQRA